MSAGTSRDENADRFTDEEDRTPFSNDNESIEKLQKTLLIKQINAAIAQEKAAIAQEKAAEAVRKAAGAVEQFVEDYFARLCEH